MAAGVKLSKMAPFEMNPRGNLWYNDENTFGRKMLSRMGWSKGKGLGKHEDGIQENIKIGKKDTLTGVGWKPDVHISVGCAEYENILSKLQQRFKNKKTEDKKPDKSKKLNSLEKRSQTSRSRLHYQKFVRAKDFFTRSEKDMKCIFLDNPKDAEEENENGVFTHKSDLSMADYFAMKMKQKLGKMIPDAKEPSIKLESEAVEKQETSKKLKKECTKSEEPRTSAEVKPAIKSEKELSNYNGSSKKRKNNFDNFNGSANAVEVEAKLKCGKEFDDSQSSSNKQDTSLGNSNEDINFSKNKLKLKAEKEFSNNDGSSKMQKNILYNFNGSTNATNVEGKIKREKEFGKSQSSSGKQDTSLESLNDSSKNKFKHKSEKEYIEKRALKKKHKNSSDTSIEDLEENEIRSEEEVRHNKKLSKKRKYSTEDVAQPKKIKLEKEDLSDEYLYSGVEKSCVEETSDMAVEPKPKKSKKRSHKLRGLKSCIKKNVSYNLNSDRKVIFNEKVSYKILDTSFESFTPINDLVVDQQNSVDDGVEDKSSSSEGEQNNEFINAEGFMTNIRQSNEISESSVKHDKKSVLDSCNGGISTHLKESWNVPVADSSDQEFEKSIKDNFKTLKSPETFTEDSLPECFKLPKRVSSYLDMWSESQRAATKMKIYKDMIRGIRTDEILRTTNLLDIKGYGNWEI